jgi:pectinesterase
VQGVALTVQGDRAVFENVRVLGNQDTLFVKTSNVATVARSYFKSCYVEGDTDFIFGRGTAVLDGCTIHSVTSRTTSGAAIAPSTDSRNPFGILVNGATFSADAGAAAGSIHLGRAWDESQGDVTTYATNVASGIYPNGQAQRRERHLPQRASHGARLGPRRSHPERSALAARRHHGATV